ncbi:type II secretion system protein [Fredinandcohnia onubensis]|uniref:type II secretion system protein n=1 Tax=Fredinandcohnia onubensis TaxID=1571209 RepID=UPI000C0C10EE|nr:type II secretion system protein [Fredinandcohnia onubensis]
MFKKHLKNQKGLTLIELLAVIVILGIIAAIAVPAIGNVINNSRDNAALADAQQIIEGAKLYVASEGISSGTATITSANLTDYVEKAGTFTSVKFTNGVYSIVGHTDANKVLGKDATTGEILESELIAELD